MRNEILNGAVLGENLVFAKELDKTVAAAISDIEAQAKRYSNNSLASTTGFVAESYHVSNYNIKSALSRKSLHAFREKNGNHGDYFIKDMKTGKIIEQGEMKFYSTAEKTENAMRGYGDRKLVGPKEQLEDIKNIARRRELSNKNTRPHVAKEHKTVGKNVADKIGDDRLSSDPKTLKEMKKLAKKAKKGNVKAIDAMPEMKEATVSALKSGALEGVKNGAIYGGGFSLVMNGIDVVKGEKDLKTALKDTSVDVVKSVADGAVKSAAASAAKTASLYVAEKTASNVAKTVLRSSAPVVVAVSAVEVGKHAVDLVKGEIDGEEFVEKSTKTVATTAAGYAGAEIGAAIGTAICPGIGTVIGGVVGGMAGSLGISTLFD